MPNTDEYLCWFAGETEEDGDLFHAYDHSHAAQQFADQAQDDYMWEHRSNDWNGDYAVVVKHLYTGSVKRFNILREYAPVFSAMEVPHVQPS